MVLQYAKMTQTPKQIVTTVFFALVLDLLGKLLPDDQLYLTRTQLSPFPCRSSQG